MTGNTRGRGGGASADYLAGVVDGLKNEIAELKSSDERASRDRRELLEKVTAIERKLAMARGGWLVFLAVISGAGAIGGVIAKLLSAVPVTRF